MKQLENKVITHMSVLTVCNNFIHIIIILPLMKPRDVIIAQF